MWKAVLMAKDHQAHHKMQLHPYLKLLGLPVNTQTLYGCGAARAHSPPRADQRGELSARALPGGE